MCKHPMICTYGGYNKPERVGYLGLISTLLVGGVDRGAVKVVDECGWWSVDRSASN